MDPTPNRQLPTTVRCHIVAVPFPGRGHINPMMSLCKLIASKTQDVLITFVVTEEWFEIIGSNSKPETIRLASIPNVIPSEQLRGLDFPEFYEAVQTKMKAPFEQLLDQLEPPVSNIVNDIDLLWATSIGNRRNIPVAILCTTSATFLNKLQYFSQIEDRDLLVNLLVLINNSYVYFSRGTGEEDETLNIPEGISPSQVPEFKNIFYGNAKKGTQLSLLAHSWVPKSQYLLFTSLYELEPQVFNTLKPKFSFPLYPIGPAVPPLNSPPNSPQISQWLDSQPTGSVLYVSLGSFVSVSSAQMDELLGGLKISGVKFLWVARGESSRLIKKGENMNGLIVDWCSSQLGVLCHDSIGGFLTHCGWNSTLEGLFAGVAMLTFPIMYDQVTNEELIVEGWRVGWRGRGRVVGDDQSLVSGQEICERVKRFMDEENVEVQNLRKRGREVREICHRARANGGSSDKNLDAFIKDISQNHYRH
ncbi:UDP-glycosyltransferase 87A1-like [Pistacia vera]|uniref:UDP-glycosyltransferase 87A1-like n=1 Tax=Pistacia vera TaxID=55513 RepID=UPI001263863E|nr:UDP-glycosyltransferase 87A1-like [Pistacia vera]